MRQHRSIDDKIISWRTLLPNGLTVTRLFAGLLFPFCGHGVRLALLLYAGISDLIDGEISRRIGATTRFGKILDPIADKTAVFAVAGTLTWEGSIAWWQLLLVAMRDLIVFGILCVAAWERNRYRLESSPLMIGKAATGGQFVYLTTVLLIPEFATFAFVVAASLSCAAALAYLHDAVAQRRRLTSP